MCLCLDHCACVLTMKYRNVLTSLIVLGLVTDVCSHVEIEAEDYFFPLEPVVNFCKMSEHCTHDFVFACGQDTSGVVRKFNDVCDLFEYNCDEKSQFHHVKMDVCTYSEALKEKRTKK